MIKHGQRRDRANRKVEEHKLKSVLGVGLERGAWRIARWTGESEDHHGNWSRIYDVVCVDCGHEHTVAAHRLAMSVGPNTMARPKCSACGSRGTKFQVLEPVSLYWKPGDVQGIFRLLAPAKGKPKSWDVSCVECGHELTKKTARLHESQLSAWECAGCEAKWRAATYPDQCRWCPNKRSETRREVFTQIGVCEACARAAGRNGNHKCCGAPIRKRSPHTCGVHHGVTP